MVRNVIGSILALAGAVGAVLSPFYAWFDGRHGSDYRIADLFNGISDSGTGPGGSILLPFAFTALVTLNGLLLRSRLLIALAGMTVLGFTILWMVRQGQDAGGLSISGDGSGLGKGVAYALGGGLLLLMAALVMSGRRRHVQRPWADAPPMVPVVQGPPPRQYWTPQDAYEQSWPPQQVWPPQENQPPQQDWSRQENQPPQQDWSRQENQPPQQDWSRQENQPPQDGDTQTMSTIQPWDSDRAWDDGEQPGGAEAPPHGSGTRRP